MQYAESKYDHTHSSGWFSKLNINDGLVRNAVKADIQPDRHANTSHYLFVDGHVEISAADQIDEWIDQKFNFAEPQ